MAKRPVTRTKIVELTEAERARFPEWVDRWVKIGMCTEPADRERFEKGARACYRFSGLAEPKIVTWVASPMALAIAGPTAAYSIELIRRLESTQRAAVPALSKKSIKDSVRASVRASVRDLVDASVDASVGASVAASVRASVRDLVRASVRASVRDLVAASVREGHRRAVHDAWYYCMGGQFWVGWGWGSPSYTSFFQDVCGLELPGDMGERARAYQATAESACWWWPHRDYVIACDRPEAIHRDEQGRLHSATEMAIRFRDGWGIYMWHGIRVPADVVLHPEAITVARIEAEQNAEIRRVLVERYGLSRYVCDASFEVIDADIDDMGMPRRLLKRGDLLVVELTNSTADFVEDDVLPGLSDYLAKRPVANPREKTRRIYHVEVEPSLRPLLSNGELGQPQELTALNAVASTYGMRGEDYRLEKET